MVSESIDPLLEQHPDRPELRLLESDFKRERDQGYAVAKAAVGNPRCCAISSLILRSGCLTASGGEITMRLKPRCVSGR